MIGCYQKTARSDVSADMETFLPSTSQVVNVRVMRDKGDFITIVVWRLSYYCDGTVVTHYFQILTD